ncbi:GcrA family cell cycle regulator [Lapidilactobacillus mulanensis]|uniref:GcrA family cell cycle regulator n=1 Tax=Lapidilactobacillus mulanensis TaxID=2485999 RepID=A0ABW4DPA0_9LACO|nr:GcrA family cell cycle regulator [Lapidilactobacillus mulanensis]
MTTEFLEHYYPLERQYPTIKEIPEEELRSLRKKYNHHHQLDNYTTADKRPVKRAEELQNYWDKGLTGEQIAQDMGISRSTVQNYLARMGLTDHKQYTIKITRKKSVHYARNIRSAARIAGNWNNASKEQQFHWLKKNGWTIEFGHWNETEVG